MKFKYSLIFVVMLLNFISFEVHADIKPSKYVEGEVIIKFKEGSSNTIKTNTFSRNNLQRKKVFKHLSMQLVKLPKGKSVQNVIASLKNDKNIEYIEPNYIWDISEIPNDTMFNDMWGLRNIGQNNGTNDADIDADEAWNLAKGDTTVVVGVIDTGVDYNHEDLKNNMWVNPFEIPSNNIDDDGNGYVDDIYGFNSINGTGDPMDDNDHGSHVSGTIGAVGNNGIGVVGVNWKARIMALKFLNASGSGNTSDAIECIDYALIMKNKGVNIKVTNNSWGGGGFSQALLDAITKLKNANILFVAAAGNSAQNIDVTLSYPAAYNVDNIISVAATDRNDQIASFSNYGTTNVDIAAPGVDVLSTTSSTESLSGLVYSGIYKLIYFSFGFEGINGQNSRLSVMQKSLDYFGLNSANSSVLLVDDDGGANYENYYINALTELGYNNYSIITVPSGGNGPSSSSMSGYDLVIWFTGNDYRTTLTSTDQASLTTFLNNGGNFLISGQDIGYNIGSTSFYGNYLRAKYIKDKVSANTFVGEGVFAGESINLATNGDGANNQNYVDVITPKNGALKVFTAIISPYGLKSGTSMASPHTAGVATLLWNYRPELSYLEIKNAIISNADKINNLNGKVFKSGRLNANNALLSILRPNQLPIAEAGNAQKWGNEFISLSFDGSTSYDPDGTIASFVWDFGDGTPTQTGANAIHTYSIAGLYTATLTVVDDRGGSATDTVIVRIANYQVRVNCGGGWYRDTNGAWWQGDKQFDTSNQLFSWGYTGGRWCTTSNPIENTNDDALYQRWRLGVNSYKFSVPNGIYEVTLKFAELLWTAPGKRIFNVIIEGNTALNNFDIYADAGHDIASSDKVFTITVTDGILEMDFIPIKNVTAINAINIKRK